MAALKGIRHIFFDLDDTLWDFKGNSTEVLSELFNEFDLKEKLSTDLERFIESYSLINKKFWEQYGAGIVNKPMLREQRFPKTFSDFGIQDEETCRLLSAEYLARTPRRTKLKAHCKEILEYLGKTYQLHLLTNGFMDVQHIKLEQSGLRVYFDQVIISEEHGLRKPEIAIFRLAETLSTAKTEECLMIGDHYENDVRGAIGAGWQAIHFHQEGPQQPGIRIQGLSELHALL